jgi:hypothetical protein
MISASGHHPLCRYLHHRARQAAVRVLEYRVDIMADEGSAFSGDVSAMRHTILLSRMTGVSGLTQGNCDLDLLLPPCSSEVGLARFFA